MVDVGKSNVNYLNLASLLRKWNQNKPTNRTYTNSKSKSNYNKEQMIYVEKLPLTASERKKPRPTIVGFPLSQNHRVQECSTQHNNSSTNRKTTIIINPTCKQQLNKKHKMKSLKLASQNAEFSAGEGCSYLHSG